jgi:hypothetical protein
MRIAGLKPTAAMLPRLPRVDLAVAFGRQQPALHLQIPVGTERQGNVGPALEVMVRIEQPVGEGQRLIVQGVRRQMGIIRGAPPGAAAVGMIGFSVIFERPGDVVVAAD